jgi:hypothetical protein
VKEPVDVDRAFCGGPGHFSSRGVECQCNRVSDKTNGRRSLVQGDR